VSRRTGNRRIRLIVNQNIPRLSVRLRYRQKMSNDCRSNKSQFRPEKLQRKRSNRKRYNNFNSNTNSNRNPNKNHKNPSFLPNSSKDPLLKSVQSPTPRTFP